MDDLDEQDLKVAASSQSKTAEKARLRYERDDLLAFRECDSALVRPSALSLDFFREQKDGDPLWSPEAWASSRTQSEATDSGSGSGSAQPRERGTPIVLGPGASRRNWSSGCGTQQGGTRNREVSGSDAVAQPDDATRLNGTFRSNSAAERDTPRFRDRERSDYPATRGNRYGTDGDTPFAGGSRGRARGGNITPTYTTTTRGGRVRIDQAGLRNNQLFEAVVGSRKEQQPDSDRPRLPENDRGFDRGFERERFDRERDFERDRDRGGFRRDRDAPYNASLSGSGANDPPPISRFGPARRGRYVDDEPEWLTGGPKDAFDCLELHGLPEDEERDRKGNEDEHEEIMEIGDDEDDELEEENLSAEQLKRPTTRPATDYKPPSNAPPATLQKLDSGNTSKKVEAVNKQDEAPKAKKDETVATGTPAKVHDVDMSKLAGSRFVNWVQPTNDEARSMRITVVNTQSNASANVPPKQPQPQSQSQPQPPVQSASTSKSTTISLNDIFMKAPQSGAKATPTAVGVTRNLPTGQNSGKPGTAPTQVKTLQELEIALGIKNDDASTAAQPNRLNALLAAISPANSNAANASAAPANRVGKPISMQLLFGTGSQPAAPTLAAAVSTPAVQNAQANSAQLNASVAKPNPAASSAQPQFSDSVQRLFQAQSLTTASSQHAGVGTQQPHPHQQPQMQMQMQMRGTNGGNGSRSASPTPHTPTGAGVQAPWSSAMRPPSVSNQFASRQPGAQPAPPPTQAQPQPQAQAQAATALRNEQIANVTAQLTNMVLSKFNASHTGQQQREQAAAAFSVSVVQAAVHMFVTQLHKSLDNPTAFFEQLETMRSNLPVVIRQFVASGIDPQLAEQFLSTIISVAPYAILMLGPQASSTQQLAAAAATATQQQPFAASNSAAAGRDQLNAAMRNQQFNAVAAQQAFQSGAGQMNMSTLAQQQQQHASLGLSAQQHYASSQMSQFASQLGAGAHGHASGPVNLQGSSAAFLNAVQQQQQIEASLARRAAMNNTAQPQMNAYAQPGRSDFDVLAGAEKRSMVAPGGQQFVPMQVLRQLASTHPKVTARTSDTDENAQQHGMRPITKASRDTVDPTMAMQSAGGPQFTGASNAAMQQQHAMLLRQQAMLATMQQAGSSHSMGKP